MNEIVNKLVNNLVLLIVLVVHLLKTEKDLKNLCKQEIQIIFIGMILMKLVSNMIWLKRTQSDKVLRDKAFKIASNPNYDDYQRGLASIVYKFFDKKSKGSGIKSMSNQQLVDQLHKPFIKNFKRRKVYSSFKDNIWVLI